MRRRFDYLEPCEELVEFDEEDGGSGVPARGVELVLAGALALVPVGAELVEPRWLARVSAGALFSRVCPRLFAEEFVVCGAALCCSAGLRVGRALCRSKRSGAERVILGALAGGTGVKSSSIP